MIKFEASGSDPANKAQPWRIASPATCISISRAAIDNCCGGWRKLVPAFVGIVQPSLDSGGPLRRSPLPPPYAAAALAGGLTPDPPCFFDSRKFRHGYTSPATQCARSRFVSMPRTHRPNVSMFRDSFDIQLSGNPGEIA